MNREIIKQVVSKDKTQSMKLYRWDGVFFVDIYEGKYLIDRKFYTSLQDGLDEYYLQLTSCFEQGLLV